MTNWGDSNKEVGQMQISQSGSPLVSVVIPSYNRAHLLSRTINSVLAQTFQDFELIVVDDGSEDETPRVLQEFCDPRIRLLRLGRNYGGNHARNRGLQAARGPWMAFLDSDDEWLPGMLEQQVARARETHDTRATVVLCLCEQREGRSRHTMPSTGLLQEGDLFDSLLLGRKPSTTSAFIARKSALLEVRGFDERLSSHHEVDLWLRLARARHRFLAVNEVLVIKYNHPGPRISNDAASQIRGFQEFDRRWGPAIRERLGMGVYEQWKERQRAWRRHEQHVRLKDEVRSGKRALALRYALGMSRFLPLSLPLMLQALKLAAADVSVIGAHTPSAETPNVDSDSDGSDL
ncbi:MAG: glycosyltransferase family 2 protein, partial [Terriglobia bacterium]